jgi:hypothetical protein
MRRSVMIKDQVSMDFVALKRPKEKALVMFSPDDAFEASSLDILISLTGTSFKPSGTHGSRVEWKLRCSVIRSLHPLRQARGHTFSLRSSSHHL